MNAVEVSIKSGVISADEQTVYDFGYVDCAPPAGVEPKPSDPQYLSMLVKAWIDDYAGDGVFVSEIISHMSDCPLCHANRLAVVKWREAADA